MSHDLISSANNMCSVIAIPCYSVSLFSVTGEFIIPSKITTEITLTDITKKQHQLHKQHHGVSSPVVDLEGGGESTFLLKTEIPKTHEP